MIKIAQHTEHIVLSSQIVAYSVGEMYSFVSPLLEEQLADFKKGQRKIIKRKLEKLEKYMERWYERLSLYAEDDFSLYHITEYAEERGRREWKSIVATAQKSIKELEVKDKELIATLMAMGYVVSAMNQYIELASDTFKKRGFQEQAFFLLNLKEEAQTPSRSNLFSFVADLVNSLFRIHNTSNLIGDDDFNNLGERTVKYILEISEPEKQKKLIQRGRKRAEENKQYR